MSGISLTQVNSPHISGEFSEIFPTTWTERFAAFLDSDETPLLYKIGAVALPLILAFAASVLAGLPLLASVVVVAFTAAFTCMIYMMEGPILILREANAALARSNLDIARQIALNAERIQQDQRLTEALTATAANQTLYIQALAFTLIQLAVGGEEAFNALPVLQTDNPLNISSLQPENLSHSVMRGVDSARKPFISLKLRSNSPNAPQEPFVITFFQREVQGYIWSYGTPAARVEDAQGNPLFNERLGALDLQSILSIIRGQHPILSLV